MIDELKEELNVTWNDSDPRLERLLKEGKAALSELIDANLDFDNDDVVRGLLLSYCRYSYNSSIEYFEENFKTTILRLQLKSAVNTHA